MGHLELPIQVTQAFTEERPPKVPSKAPQGWGTQSEATASTIAPPCLITYRIIYTAYTVYRR